MRYSLRPIFIALVGISLAGCAHSVKTRNITELGAIAESITGFAIPFVGETEPGFVTIDRCFIQFRNLESGALNEIDFASESKIVIAELPAGTYSYRSFGCGPREFNLSFKEWPNPTVYPGKLSVIAGLHITMHSTDTASLGFPGRKLTQSRLKDFFDGAPPALHPKIVSAFTGLPIEKAPLASPFHPLSASKGYDETLKQTIEPDGDNWPSFETCYETEKYSNGLWLNDQPVKLTYLDSNLTQFEMPKTWNSFSKTFLDCIRPWATGFHPRSKGKLTFSLYL